MKIIQKILVPTDFSELSLAGIEFVRSLAVLYDAELFLLHVLDLVPAMAYPNVDLSSETVLRDKETVAMKQLQGMMKQLFPTTRAISPVVRRGDPHKEIVRFAEEEGIDLVVIATHGRTGLAHVLMGSVAEKVVRHSSVPVLTIKPTAMRPPLMEQADINEQLHIH